MRIEVIIRGSILRNVTKLSCQPSSLTIFKERCANKYPKNFNCGFLEGGYNPRFCLINSLTALGGGFMVLKNEGKQPGRSIIAQSYSSGDYFADTQRHKEDSKFKAKDFLKLFLPLVRRNNLSIDSLVDVGCGSGDIVKIISDSLKANGFDSMTFKAYDVSPHILDIKHDNIEYIHEDFCMSNDSADIVTLFDVFEHVPDPIEFIKSIAQRSNIVGLHIPLDYSLNTAIRNKFRSKLHHPGHLVFMEIASALNLLAFSGLKVVDYEYTFNFLVPSGHRSILSKMMLPLRYLLAKINPWLLSITFGGASLMVIAMTPNGLKKYSTIR